MIMDGAVLTRSRDGAGVTPKWLDADWGTERDTPIVATRRKSETRATHSLAATSAKGGTYYSAFTNPFLTPGVKISRRPPYAYYGDVER